MSSRRRKGRAPTSEQNDQLDISFLVTTSSQDPTFWQGCPDPSVSNPEDADDTGPTITVQGTTALQPWLTWLCSAVTRDPGVHLAFPPSLAKQQRAVIHKLVESGYRELEAVSSGLGDERAISVHRRGAVAPNNRGVTSEVHQQAQHLHRYLARASGGHQAACHTAMSLDEITEALATGRLPEDLQLLQASLVAAQPALGQLMTAVQADDAQQIQVWADQHPDLIQEGVPHLASGDLPLQVAARLGHLAALHALGALGAPLEAQDMRGHTALQVARAAEQTDAEAVLLQLGSRDAEEHSFPLSLAAATLGGI